MVSRSRAVHVVVDFRATMLAFSSSAHPSCAIGKIHVYRTTRHAGKGQIIHNSSTVAGPHGAYLLEAHTDTTLHQAVKAVVSKDLWTIQ